MNRIQSTLQVGINNSFIKNAKGLLSNTSKNFTDFTFQKTARSGKGYLILILIYEHYTAFNVKLLESENVASGLH